jgi:competence protein ComEC
MALAVWVRPAIAVALAGSVALALAATREQGRRQIVLVGGSLALAGLAWGGLRADALDRSVLATRIGETASARVVVTGPSRTSRFAVRAPGIVTRFAGLVIRERVLLQLPLGRAPPQGAVLEARARPVLPRGPETGFDERGWLARQGVHVVLRVSDARLVGRRGGIGGVADRLRAHIIATLASGTTGERRALVTGIVLGEESELAPALRDAFRASGLTHLLAVSGQNVAITAIGVVVGLRILGVGKLVGEAAAIVAVLAYALAAGWQPSVVRAAVAGCLASLAWLASRPRDRWHALALGALVLLVWSPFSILEPGFQLSFTAVAAIFVLVPRIERWLEGTPIAGRPAELLALAGACGAVTAPIVFVQFGAVPVWTVPANMLAEPAMGPLVGLSLLAALVEPVAPAVAASLAWLAGWCAAWIAWVARLVSGWPAAQVTSRTAFGSLLAAVTVVVAITRAPRWRRASWSVVSLAVALALAVGWWSLRERPQWTPPTGLRMTVLDVGQGDGILLETDAGAVLVDQGPPEARVLDQLQRRGVRSLTAIVLTHPQRDHIGGAADVLRGLDVGAVIDPALAASGSVDQAAALSEARRRGVRVVLGRAGRVYRIGKLRLDVLWPDGPGLPGEDPNLRATVVLARFGMTRILLAADAESDVTLRLRVPRVDVLKVAHHGSADPGLPELLRRLRPRVAVISVAAVNDYGHPTPETLADLHAAPGLDVYRTDRDGAVTIETDGRSVTVHTAR